MIIFDLGGVLLQEAEVNMAQALPADLDIERVNGRPPRIFYRTFEFVNLIFNKECKKDFFLGNLTGLEIVEKIKECIDKKEYDFFFKNSQERTLIKYGSELILLPEKEASLTTLHQDGLDFVKRCKKNGARILILSNWQPESFALIKKKFPELFGLFDAKDIIIPALVGAIKPEPEIYIHMIKKLNLDVNRTFFIDDSAKNIAAAQACGIKGVVHRNWKQTEQELLLRGLKITTSDSREVVAQ